MNKAQLLACVALGLSALLLSPHRMLSEEDDHPPLTAQVFLTNAQIDPNENNQVIRAFVPTGSKRLGCLATLNDTNNVALGTLVFCGNRQPSGFGGVPGVLVSVFFPQPVVPNLSLTVTVHQDGAEKYGAPVRCVGPDGC